MQVVYAVTKFYSLDVMIRSHVVVWGAVNVSGHCCGEHFRWVDRLSSRQKRRGDHWGLQVVSRRCAKVCALDATHDWRWPTTHVSLSVQRAISMDDAHHTP